MIYLKVSAAWIIGGITMWLVSRIFHWTLDFKLLSVIVIGGIAISILMNRFGPSAR